MSITLNDVPIGSLVELSDQEREGYLGLVFTVPSGAREVLFSDKTSAFVRGLVKNYNIQEAGRQAISLAILKVVIGKISFVQLPSVLSTEAKLPNDQAQKIAKEIEADLLKPVRAELDEFWAKRNEDKPIMEAEKRAAEGGARNVLNLKKEQKPPAPPWREER